MENETIRWSTRSVLAREPDQLSEGQEDMLDERPEACNFWNWEWNPSCVCTECYLG